MAAPRIRAYTVPGGAESARAPEPATVELPLLIVGDVHGDLERLFKALKPYPADRWRTVFVGDLVDYGLFGVGTLRFARDRPNTTVVLGNHEVAMMWALHDPQRVGWWMGIGGQQHDLDELAKDLALQAWLHARPALIRLPDHTLVQHCGHDGYARWLERGDDPDPVAAVNKRVHELLVDEGEGELWETLSTPNVFAQQPLRLERWLQATNCRRVIFGHTPHKSHTPEVYHGGLAINFDGAFSRGHRKYTRSPVAASVAPLDVLS
jgi:Calcineurin-like phosphoesterase